jgi:hypothetical protein
MCGTTMKWLPAPASRSISRQTSKLQRMCAKGSSRIETALEIRGRHTRVMFGLGASRRGIRHTEVNAYAVPTKIFRIWIGPREKGGPPRWGTRP